MPTPTTNETAVTNTTSPGNLSIFESGDRFEHFQRVAKALAASDLVPQQFKGNIPNTLIALDMADRLKANPLAVMQSIYVVHGKPSWAATFIIAQINSCGKFSPVRYEMTGEGDKKTCVAWAKELDNGERIEGPEVSIAMAKAEGWYDRNGSKWKTMPDLMLRYRAATLFGRLYCPELMMGMRTDDEVGDIIDITAAPPIRVDKPDLMPPLPEPASTTVAVITKDTTTGETKEVQVERPIKKSLDALAKELEDAGLYDPNEDANQKALIALLDTNEIPHEVFANYLNVNGIDKKLGFSADARPIADWPSEVCEKIGKDTELMARATKRFGGKK